MAIPRRIGLAAAAVLALLSLSCSRQALRSETLRGELLGGSPGAAYEVVAAEEDCESVDCLLERGHLAYLAGEYDRSQEDLARAAELIQENWTRSLTREAATFVVNDEMRAYDGERFERLWLHFYRALGYLALGERGEAAVEGRALTERMTVMAEEGDETEQYRNDPFLQYFAGMLYESQGDLNDAWICYRQAERLYQCELYGAPAPPALGRDLLRTARRLSFTDEVRRLQSDYAGARFAEPGPGEGELILLVSEGLVPAKVGHRIDFPIFEDDDDDDGWDAWTLASNSYYYRSSWDAGDIDYWVSVALPGLAEGTRAPRLDWSAGGYRGELAPAADLGALSRQCFEEEIAGVTIRALARALVKYQAAQKAEDEGGFWLKALVNLFGAVTEQADTRAWSSLPERVHLARVALPAGEQSVTVEGAGAAGATVFVPEDGMVFLHLRLY